MEITQSIYTGRNHGCTYFYAAKMAKRWGKDFTNVEPRKGIVEATKKQIEREEIKDKLIHLCFTCDPYPADIKTSVTREIIKAIKDSGNHVQILTKGGDRAERDLDLLYSDDWFGLTHTNDSYFEPNRLEPKAAPAIERLTSLKRAKQYGIKTWVSCESLSEPETVYSLIKDAEYFDLYKIGKLNYVRSDINWSEFGKECERLCIWLLREYGLVVNHKSVLRIMRKYGLLATIRRPRPLYRRQQKVNVYENKLNRIFRADKPNQKWVTDISYIHTNEGVLYLSAIKDLYDNFIVAYDMGTAQDNALVYRTVQKAKKEIANGLILHSDQGSQYTSPNYFDLTKQYSILPSMSRAGTPLDNAPIENFFGILKTECIYRQKIHSINQAKNLIVEYIYFYNYQRIQLNQGLTPFEKRSQYA